MDQDLPLFPLTTALVPGLVLPLHIFEPRYRLMVEELLARPEGEREFGVVAVRERRHSSRSSQLPLEDVYSVGVTALIRQAERREDGRYDITTIGARRFSIDQIDRSAPLLRANVTFLPEPEVDIQDPRVQRLTQAAARAFTNYRSALGGRLEEDQSDEDTIPDDPSVLSYLITAALVTDAPTRQELLASPDAITRLQAGIAVLKSETGLISTLGAVPALDLLSASVSEN